MGYIIMSKQIGPTMWEWGITVETR